MMLSAMLIAVFTGMANPMPSEPPDEVAITALMPISLAFPSQSAPPELPGLIAASVCMRSVRTSFDVPPVELAPTLL